MALALPCRLRGASWRRRRRQKWPRVVAPGAARAYVRDARGRDKRGRSVPRQADARPGPRTATEGFQLAPGGAATRQVVCVCVVVFVLLGSAVWYVRRVRDYDKRRRRSVTWILLPVPARHTAGLPAGHACLTCAAAGRAPAALSCSSSARFAQSTQVQLKSFWLVRSPVRWK